MANPEAKVEALLRQHGFRLVRATRHRVFVNPEGRVFVTSSTPSDFRAFHNQLTALKRCLAAPPVPMVLAISEYEREQAAAIIQAAPRATVGQSSGKHHRSRGTGYKYEEKILTEEQIAEREKLAEVARAAAARREERRQERRARKLAQKEAKAEQKQQAEQAYITTCGPFLDVLWRALNAAEREYVDFQDVSIASPMWLGAGDFYEFATTKAGKEAEEDVKSVLREAHKAGERITTEFMDEMCRRAIERAKLLKSASAERIDKVMTFLEKKVRRSQDALLVLWELYIHLDDNHDNGDVLRNGQLFVMDGLYHALWAYLAERCEEQEPGALHGLISLELNGEHIGIVAADSAEDEDALGMPPIPEELVDTYPYFLKEVKAEKEARAEAA